MFKKVLPLLFCLLPLTGLAAEPGARTVRALVVAETEAVISAELSGKVRKLPFSMGQTFKKKDLLVEFTCDTHRASLDESRSELSAAQKVLNVNRKLQAFQSVSELELALAEAKVETARAKVRLHQARCGQCRILAPFSGRVVNQSIRAYEYAQEGMPIIHIVDNANLRLQLFVPSDWISWIKVGQNVQAEIEETGTQCQASVKAISAQIDPKSQSVEIWAKIVNPGPELLPGMSGTAHFPTH